MYSELGSDLSQHQKALESISLKSLFENDAHRFEKFSFEVCDVLFDFSKQRITEETIQKFVLFAERYQLDLKRQRLFSENKLNSSENRAVLHPLLRDVSQEPFFLEGQDLKPKIQQTLKKLEAFAHAIHTNLKRGVTDKAFQDVLCLGIGGSELGPALMVDAMNSIISPLLRVHFISNIDGKSLKKMLETLNPETTLCIISSKTFTTPETLLNANQIKKWFEAYFEKKDISAHFVGVTANKEKALAFGIPEDQLFEFWDWVGGRYSIWSAVGLPIILAHGFSFFSEFLQGGRDMDRHFLQSPWSKNVPFLMAAVGIWNTNFWQCPAQAILPYEDGLKLLPNYLQQLEMESNGKSVNKNSEKINTATCPVIFGAVGCNSQHAFMQLLHQSNQAIPVDFLVPAKVPNELIDHHKLLLTSCLTQSKALMEGTEGADLFKSCPGNRPSTTIMYPKLTPKILGAILAAYEHKVFVQGILWDINSFDQWGVELGKKLTQNIVSLLDQNLENHPLDSSTKGLIHFFQRQNNI